MFQAPAYAATQPKVESLIINPIEIDIQSSSTEINISAVVTHPNGISNASVNATLKDSKGNTVTEGEAMSSRFKAIMLSDITPELYEKRAAIFEKIRSIILPEQRSPEWFAMRSGKITASDEIGRAHV